MTAERGGSLAAALGYHRRGWAVLPLTGKTPHARVLADVYNGPEWGHLRDRRASAPEIREWFRVDPGCDIGIITGRSSGGLVVVDVDRPDRFADVQHPATPIVKTSRGFHAYFRAAGPVEGGAFAWGELKADGGYVVAPPSVHESGHVYHWILSPDDVEQAPLPAVLGDRSKGTIRGTPSIGTVPMEGTSSAAPQKSAVDLALGSSDLALKASMRHMGIAGRIGKIACALPGHEDRRPSAGFFRGAGDGVWRYRCHACDVTLSLAELYATRLNGRLVRLNAPSRSRWYDRLWHEAGLLELPPFDVRLPEASDLAVLLAAGYVLLAKLRGARDPGEDGIPYGRRFVMPWCAVTEWQAQEGLRELRSDDVGWLERAGKFEPRVGVPYRVADRYRVAQPTAAAQRGAA
jgi:hypothetical protein